jgi:hypothetical protein
MGECNKIVLRLVPDRAVVLNSRERAPFVLFVETMEIPDSSSDDTEWPRHTHDANDNKSSLDSSPKSPFPPPAVGDSQAFSLSQLATDALAADPGSPLVSAAPVDDAQASSVESATATELAGEELSAQNVARNGVIDRVPSEEALRQMMSSMHVTNLAEPRDRGLLMRVFDCASAASRASSCVGRLTNEGTSIGGSPPISEGSFQTVGRGGGRGRRASMSDLRVMRECSICTPNGNTNRYSRHAGDSSSPECAHQNDKWPSSAVRGQLPCEAAVADTHLKRAQSCDGSSPCVAMPGRSRQSTAGSNSSWINVDDEAGGTLRSLHSMTPSTYGASLTSNFTPGRQPGRVRGEQSDGDTGQAERRPSTVGALPSTCSAATRALRQQQVCQLTEEDVQRMSRAEYVEHIYGARLSDVITQVRKMSPYGQCASSCCFGHCDRGFICLTLCC